MSLRRATLADAVAIRDLTRAAYAKWVPLIGREPLPMRVDYSVAVVEHIIDVYEAGDRIAALLETVPQGSHLLIENIAVSPDVQGKGIGNLLLDHAEAMARALHLGEVRLYTNAAFASNIEFYAHRGFQEFQREPFPTGGVTVYMRKMIEPA
ncbi:MAG: GNAT family N-acetyltransferase [Aestuariivirga sp.]